MYNEHATQLHIFLPAGNAFDKKRFPPFRILRVECNCVATRGATLFCAPLGAHFFVIRRYKKPIKTPFQQTVLPIQHFVALQKSTVCL